jgi:CheY-like chemotaxis protein
MTGGKKTILIVDDDELNIKLITMILEREGYRVVAAGDAEQGIPLACREPPCLIVLDMKLPGMSGLEATRRLKSESSTARVPILLLTASALYDDMARAYDCGCDYFVTKPIDMKAFTRQIRDIVP